MVLAAPFVISSEVAAATESRNLAVKGGPRLHHDEIPPLIPICIGIRSE